MKRTVSAVKARQNLGELLDSVYHSHDWIIIERDGKPMAALVPPEILEEKEKARARFFEMVRQIQERNRDTDPAEVERVIAEVMAEVRGKRPSDFITDVNDR